MSSAQQQTNSTTQSSPWAAQIPWLQEGFGGAGNALSQAQSNAAGSTYGAPTQFLAGFNPQQLSNFWNEINYANNSNIPSQFQGAGTSFLNNGQTDAALASARLGEFNPFTTNNIYGASAAGNAYAGGANIPAQVEAAMLPAEQQLTMSTLPQMDRTAAATGNSNSTAPAVREGMAQGMLGQQALATGANLEANYYNTGAGLYNSEGQANNQANLSAYSGLGGFGSAYGNTGMNAIDQALNSQGSLYGMAGAGAMGLQEAAQNRNANQLQAFNFGQSSPFTALDNFWNIIGSGQWGGTSNTNSTTTYTPSMMQTIGGMMGGLGTMFGGNGMFGSGNGGGAFGSNGVFGGANGNMMGGQGWGGYGSAADGSVGDFANLAELGLF